LLFTSKCTQCLLHSYVCRLNCITGCLMQNVYISSVISCAACEVAGTICSWPCLYSVSLPNINSVTLSYYNILMNCDILKFRHVTQAIPLVGHFVVCAHTSNFKMLYFSHFYFFLLVLCVLLFGTAEPRYIAPCR